LKALGNLPPDITESLPLSIDQLMDYADAKLVVDMDTDADGEPDVVSFAYKFTSIAAHIVGLTEVE